MSYDIGQKFISRGKHPKMKEVADIHRTYNSKDELIKITYICTHDFLGQKVKSEECETTIAMSLSLNPINE